MQQSKMIGQGVLCVLLFLFCNPCEIKGFVLGSAVCHLEDNQLGKCVTTSVCPKSSGEIRSANRSNQTCEAGKTCCRVNARIVTPDAGNSGTIYPVIGSSGSTTGSPQWVTVPSSSSSGSGFPSGNVPQGGSAPSGSAPSSGNAPPSGSTSASGNVPISGGSQPSGGGAAPPSGTSPPAGGAGGLPPAGVPPSGGSIPPLMGNIVAAPSFPYPNEVENSDTIVVSAEVIDKAVNMFDRKCDLYHSMIPAEVTVPPIQGTPVVMIFGGIDSESKEFPHMAALGYGEPTAIQWLCGGSLITENFVITAAHCILTQSLGEVRYVRLGNLRLDQDTQNTQLYNVIRRITHEQYDRRTNYNDIGLLQLDQVVRITAYVMPICLFSSTNYEDRNLIATGWGKTETTSSSLNLQKVGLELFSQIECQNAYGRVSRQQLPLGIQESIQLCAGSHSQSKDTCQGDSGGPLQIRKNNRWYLIGITSIGLQCGVANVPGVYTRIANYIQWIQQYVWNK